MLRAIEYAVMGQPPHPLMAGWRCWRVEIGTPAKFGGDGYEMHMWTPPHINAEALESFLTPLATGEPECTK